MNGLLLKLLDDKTSRPGYWFWKCFGCIRPDLDRYYWLVENQPWMGTPYDQGWNDELHIVQDCTITVWKPGTLGRFAQHFGEEFIELWAIEPTLDDPIEIAREYSGVPPKNITSKCEIRNAHARVWLLYTDGSCWEIYTRKKAFLETLKGELQGKNWIELYEAQSGKRENAFRVAGLSHWIPYL